MMRIPDTVKASESCVTCDESREILVISGTITPISIYSDGTTAIILAYI